MPSPTSVSRCPVPQGVPWYPDDLDAWSVRWVLMHLVSETARHAGHADIVREAVDGATAFPLMAAAEGWPATPWIQPWEPGVREAMSIAVGLDELRDADRGVRAPTPTCSR